MSERSGSKQQQLITDCNGLYETESKRVSSRFLAGDWTESRPCATTIDPVTFWVFVGSATVLGFY